MQFSTAILAAAAAGLTVAAPTLESRYSPGQCGIHVQQFQKNENGVGGEYEFTIQIKDAIGAIIGGVAKQPIADFSTFALSSQLPAQLLVTVGSVDSDPIQFAYNGQTFSSSNGCSTGAYDSGSRNLDCGFQC